MRSFPDQLLSRLLSTDTNSQAENLCPLLGAFISLDLLVVESSRMVGLLAVFDECYFTSIVSLLILYWGVFVMTGWRGGKNCPSAVTRDAGN